MSEEVFLSLRKKNNVFKLIWGHVYAHPIWLFVIVFFVNTILVFYIYPMRTGADEFNVLSIASYFSGRNWDSYMRSIAAYHGFCQALLYTPLYWLFDDPVLIYRGAILINGILISFIPIVADQLLHRIWNLERSGVTFMVCLVTGLWPFHYAASKMAWNEPLTILLMWVVLYLVCALIKSVRFRILYASLLGFVFAFGYALHGRMLIIIIGAIGAGLLGFLVSWRKNKGQGVPCSLKKVFFITSICFVVFGLTYLLGRIIQADLMENLWRSNSLINGMDSVLAKTKFLTIGNIKVLFKLTVGQLYYMIVAFFGLTLPALWAMLRVVIRGFRAKKDAFHALQSDFVISLMLLLCFIGMIGLTSFSMLEGISIGAGRGDYVVYGRYAAPLYPIIILYGFHLWRKKFLGKMDFFAGGVLYVLIFVATIVWVVPFFTIQPTMGGSSITDMIPWMTDFPTTVGKVDFLESSYLALLEKNNQLFTIGGSFGFLLYILFAAEKKAILSFFVIIGAFSYSNIYMSTNIILPGSNAPYMRAAAIVHFFNEEEKHDISDIYFYQGSVRNPSEIQFLLPDYNLHMMTEPLNPNTVCTDLADIPENSFVMSTSDLLLDCYFDDAYWLMTWKDDLLNLVRIDESDFNLGTNYFLWFRGEELAETLRQEGYTLEKRSSYIPLDSNATSWDPFRFLINAQQTDGVITLFPGNPEEHRDPGTKFGPYFVLPAGSYQVTVQGENLLNAHFDVYAKPLEVLGTEMKDISGLFRFEIVSHSDTECILEVFLEEMLPNVEFRVVNLSPDENVRIASMGYERSE